MKKKKILKIIFLIILIFVLLVISNQVFGMFYNKLVCEKDYLDFASKNEKTIFSIDKCVFFSNCNATNKTTSNSSFILEDLYQYTDIALFINNNSSENSLENTLKSVKINNLHYDIVPSVGSQKIYYKNINSFANSDIPKEFAFENELVFNVSSNDNEDLSGPTLYNNCANPIVLSYINDNLKNDYALNDVSTTSITYDGSLLKRCGILLNSLKTNFSFDIYITNNLDQEFKCTVFIEPPVQDDSSSLYDGAMTKTLNTNFLFYRYK